MMHTGWALADRHLSEKYVKIEDKAREANRGLWRGQFIPPWKWRERQRGCLKRYVAFDGATLHQPA
jgi:endonuclease YncB( thermonuclease family)